LFSKLKWVLKMSSVCWATGLLRHCFVDSGGKDASLFEYGKGKANGGGIGNGLSGRSGVSLTVAKAQPHIFNRVIRIPFGRKETVILFNVIRGDYRLYR
jgi:hypothetical protein